MPKVIKEDLRKSYQEKIKKDNELKCKKIIKFTIDFCKKTKKVPTHKDLKPIASKDQILKFFGGISNLMKNCKETEPKVFEKINLETKNEINKKQKIEEIIKIYINLVNKIHRHPSVKQLEEAGASVGCVRTCFGNNIELRNEAKKRFPENFKNILDLDDFTEERAEKISKDVKTHKRFFITSFVNGCNVNENAFLSVKNWCKVKKGLLLIQPSHDPAHNLDNAISKYSWTFDPLIANEHIVCEDIFLNDNIFVSSILVGAKQINPLTSLGHITRSRGTAIFASPKQSLEYDAVSNNRLPHARMSTGVITYPDYTTNRFMSERTAYIAEHDHVMGGIIVEIENNKIFYFRQVQFDKDGGFCDLDTYYTKDKIKPIEGFIKCNLTCGDWHAEENDPLVKKATAEIINLCKPEEIILEDFNNGTSHNPHNKGKMITLSKMAKSGRLSVEREFAINGDHINWFTSQTKKVVIVRSNHDDFVNRWLEGISYANDPHNFEIGVILSYHAIQGENPLQKGMELYGNIKNPEKIHWLKKNESYIKYGIDFSSHGDKGPNGSRGSMKSLERSLVKAVIGHSHTPGILRGIYQVGTSSILKPEFIEGPSSWMQTHCLSFDNGQRQLINIIEGKWHLED